MELALDEVGALESGVCWTACCHSRCLSLLNPIKDNCLTQSFLFIAWNCFGCFYLHSSICWIFQHFEEKPLWKWCLVPLAELSKSSTNSWMSCPQFCTKYLCTWNSARDRISADKNQPAKRALFGLWRCQRRANTAWFAWSHGMEPSKHKICQISFCNIQRET